MGKGIPASAVTVNFDCGQADAPARMNCAGLWPFTATEVRNFMNYDGKLFMGTGVWMDQVTPNIGPAILMLRNGNGQFEIEQIFTARDTAICLLHMAHFERPTKYTVPVCSTWQAQGFNDLHYRDYNNASWHFAQCVAEGGKPVGSASPQIRCAFNYTDPETDVSMLFLGETPNGVFSIKHDPNRRGGLAQAILELPTGDLDVNEGAEQNRVMSFGVVRGKLCCTIHNRLFERQNGPRATWRFVHEDEACGSSESGLRGLTTVGGETSDAGYFFVGREADNAAVLRLTPPETAGGAWTQTVEYDMPERLSEAWTALYGGQVGADYGIVGYNNMTWFQPRGPSGPWALFCGIESFVHKWPANMPVIEMNTHHLHAVGAYLVWNFEGRGEWRLNHLPAVTSQPMISCRVGIVNPWGGPRFYIGGVDCNYEPRHNSGWVVSLDMARMLEGAVA